MISTAVCVRDAFSPVPSPSSLRTWHVVRAAHALDGPCGDRAFVLPLDSDRLAIVVVDVAGHGAARAALSSAIAEAITSTLLRDPSPAAALGGADDRLRACEDESPYAVAFVALVHPRLRTVVYASAGHDIAFVLADDGRVRHLPPTASMLGIPITVNPCDAMFVLEPTETLVIATDGVADSRPAGSAHFFGAERTARAVARSLRAGHDPARGVLEAACAHEGGRQADDMGVVVVRVTRDRLPPRDCCARGPSHGVGVPSRIDR